MFQRSRSKLEKFVTYNDGVPLATLDEEPIGELDDTGKLNQNEKGEQSIGKEGLGVEVGMIQLSTAENLQGEVHTIMNVPIWTVVGKTVADRQQVDMNDSVCWCVGGD